MSTPRPGSSAHRLVFALALALGGCGPRGPGDTGSAPTDRAAQVAAAVVRGEDRVTPAELSDWLVSATPTPRLYDLRAPEAYAAGHITGATHLPLGEAAGGVRDRQLAASGRVVVYAEDSSPAAQVAVLLRLAGVEAYGLEGGYRGWMAHLTGGSPPAARDPAADARRLAAACRQSEAYAATRTSGFLPAARAAEPPSDPGQAAAPPAAEPDPGAQASPAAPPAASPGFTPPVLPAQGSAPAAPEAGGLIVNEGC